MTDIGDRLREADLIPAPDLSTEIAARASRVGDDQVVVLDRARPRARALVAMAAAFTLLGGAAVGLTALRGEPDAVVAGGDASWLTDDGGSTLSCVEEFTPSSLAGRSWAFDGTIVEVVPGDPLSSDPNAQVTLVTFRVSHWYAGGSGETVTVKTSAVPGTATMNGDADPSLGARLLASGEDEYLWGCGFTMPYTEQGAATFADAFPA